MTSQSKALFSSDFKRYFSKVPIISKHFNSVRAIDQLPKTLPVRQFLIVNASPSNHRGSHWFVIFRSHKDSIEIFNSLGNENLNQLKPYLKFKFKARLFYNNTQVQLSTSSSCGLYCIYFAIFRLLNIDQPLDEILDEIFCTNLNQNENKVEKFCQHLLNMNDESDLFDF